MTFTQKALKVSILFAEASLTKMDKECKGYMKVSYKKSEQIYKSFCHIAFLEICKSFQLMPKGLEAKNKNCVGGVTSKVFKKKWDGNFLDMESKCRDLLLEKSCKKLFYFMNCFWKAVVDEDVDISWLVKVRNHLDQIEKEQAKTKWIKLARLYRNSHLKRTVLQGIDEHLPHFQFKSEFLSYCNSLCPRFENLCTIVTINKTSKHPKGESASSQTCQDDINLTEVLNEEKKSNDRSIVQGIAQSLVYKPVIIRTQIQRFIRV